MALSSIAIKQTKATTSTMEKAKQLLDYSAMSPNATMRFKASDMIMNVHLDASYLSKANAQSRACRHFFMGWDTKDGDPIKLNGAFFILCTILRFIVASAAKAKLRALFLNCKDGMTFRMTLEEQGHPQPKTIVHSNNATAVGIANNMVKRQCSQSMEMRYFWVCDKVAEDACIMLNSTLGRKIVPITKVRTWGLYPRGTYTQKNRPRYYQGQPDLLELSPRVHT
jgi:hypothetical protein